MKKSKIILATLIALSSRIALAEVTSTPVDSATDIEACSTVDLSDEVGPVRNQGESNNCYANTAADLLTQKLRSVAPEAFAQDQVSAMDVTYQYFRNSPLPENPVHYKSPYSESQLQEREDGKRRTRNEDLVAHPRYEPGSPGGGYIDQAINAYKTKALGICTEAELPSDDDHVNKFSAKVLTEIDSRARSLADAAKDSPERISLHNQVWSEAIERTCHRKKISFKKVLQRTESVETAPTRDGTFKFIMKQPDGSSADVTDQFRHDLQGTMDAGLNAGRIVALDLTPTFLSSGFKKRRLMRQHARHAVSIVSRTRVNDKCYYKIRNSWGLDCAQYNRKYVDLCVRGYIWVQREDLLPYVFRAQYLE